MTQQIEMTQKSVWETISVLNFTNRTRTGNIAVTVTNFTFNNQRTTIRKFPAGGSKPARFISIKNSIGVVI
jgi:hypothetical protein